MRHIRGCGLLLAALFATSALGAEPAQIKIRIGNNCVAILDFGFLGNGGRNGTDIAEGTLSYEDGTVESYSEDPDAGSSSLPVQAYSNWKIRVEKL